MALDLEEQEQLDSLKSWWRERGPMLVTAVSIALLVFAGWQGWRWMQSSRAQEASTLYDALVKGVQAGDPKAVRDAGGTLAEKFPGVLYASMGALVSARFHADRNDLKNARAQLQWVIERTQNPEFRDIARLRLAALQLDEKAYDAALATLAAAHGKAFEAQFAALRGDVQFAAGRTAEAKAAWKAALEAAPKAEQALVEGVRMRLEALGG